MTMVVGLLEELLAATPPAPAADADPTEVGRAVEVMMAQRAEILERLRVVLGPQPSRLSDPTVAPVWAAIRERSDGWDAALQRARTAMGQRVVAVRRHRQTVRTDDSSDGGGSRTG